ncbi:MAG TPA: hypothetical protein V6C86_16465 [Oculatellaceae cyanobacterium]
MMKSNSLITIVVAVASLALSLPALADSKLDEAQGKNSPQAKQPWQQETLKSLPPDVVMDSRSNKSMNLDKIPGTGEPWSNTLLKLRK